MTPKPSTSLRSGNLQSEGHASPATSLLRIQDSLKNHRKNGAVPKLTLVKPQSAVKREIRILCVGHDAAVLITRCAVLVHAGYVADSMRVEEAQAPRRHMVFDLVILPWEIREQESDRVLVAVGNAKPIFLKGFTSPQDLLKKVEEQILTIDAGVWPKPQRT